MLKVYPQGLISKIADYIMMPCMYALQGSVSESPQRTHFWNNLKLTAEDVRFLETEGMVSVAADQKAISRWFFAVIPIFHMPIFGGWKEYVVVCPVVSQNAWFVGWIADDVIGVSQIPLTSGVRLLINNGSVQFFGVNEHGNQIYLEETGRGIVGKASVSHNTIPLR